MLLAQLLLIEHRMPCRHATFCLSGDFNIDHKMTAAAVEAKDKDEEIAELQVGLVVCCICVEVWLLGPIAL